ncbi:hypothetical protein Avbf_11538 [Armadillidium vulgare]|nr:hypothetical protein Avbf_11538 [Armadillidium vulgare]
MYENSSKCLQNIINESRWYLDLGQVSYVYFQDLNIKIYEKYQIPLCMIVSRNSYDTKKKIRNAAKPD